MKNKRFLSLFFICFFKLIIHSQEKKIDSLFFIETIKNIKKLASLKKYEEVLDLSRKIIEKRKNKNELANDYYRLGFYFKKNKEIDSAYNYYLKANQIYLSINDTLNIAKQLLKISKLESEQELYNKSDSSAVSVLKYLRKKNKLYSSTYNCLAINSRHKKEYKEAIKWYSLAIKASLDSINKIRYISNQANVFSDLKNYKRALLNHEKIRNSIYYDSISLELRTREIDNYAYAKFLDNQNISELEFLKAQEIKKRIHDDYGLIANYSHLSDFYQKLNSFKALEYAYKMYALSKKINLSTDKIAALDKIIILENNTNVRKYAKERSRLSDSLQFAKQQSQNKFAKIIYNYEKEEKQKLKAEVALEKQKSQKSKIIFGSLLLFIIFIIYLIYKHQKTKKEKVIEVYKTETRLAKKIHDELANGVYLVMNKAQQPNHQNVSLLPDLEKIYALTRDISHENSKVLTGNNFENYLNQLFIQFSTGKCKVLTKGIKNSNLNALAKEKQIVIYRVLQELLINMKKHSEATLVVISFSELKNKLSINYKDNGKGVNSIKSKNGIENMDTRIKSINGIFSFETEENKGFKASIQFKK